jgi:thymidylate synthase (FAD)
MQPNVRLLSMSYEPIKTVLYAIKTCRDSDNFGRIGNAINDMLPDAKIRLIHKVMKMGHMSVIEHVSFTFGIEGVSRSFLAQLSRHRLASLSVESQRAVDVSHANFVVPDSIKEDVNNSIIFKGALEHTISAYKRLIENGVPLEDARYLLPNATPTKMVFTSNARELHHIFDVRLCLKAQEEIRQVVTMMKDEVQTECYELFPDELIGPLCNSMGICTQQNTTCPNFKKLLQDKIDNKKSTVIEKED